MFCSNVVILWFSILQQNFLKKLIPQVVTVAIPILLIFQTTEKYILCILKRYIFHQPLKVSKLFIASIFDIDLNCQNSLFRFISIWYCLRRCLLFFRSWHYLSWGYYSFPLYCFQTFSYNTA